MTTMERLEAVREAIHNRLVGNTAEEYKIAEGGSYRHFRGATMTELLNLEKQLERQVKIESMSARKGNIAVLR